IVGVIAALEYWFEERDPAAERRRWDAELTVIADRLARLDGGGSEIVEPHGVDRVPALTIVWDRGKFPIHGLTLRQRLLDGEPRIMLDDNSATENSIALDPFQLQPGEAAEIGDAVVRALGTARRDAVPAAR